MGIHDGVSSYLQLLAKVFAGMSMSRRTSDVLAVGGLLFGIGGAIFSAAKARRRA
jgi:nitrate/nitrite transporter NarK